MYISLTLVQNHNIRSQVLPELLGQVFLDDQIYMTVLLSSIAQYVFCSFQSLQVVLLLDKENIAGLGDPFEGMRAAADTNVSMNCRHQALDGHHPNFEPILCEISVHRRGGTTVESL